MSSTNHLPSITFGTIKKTAPGLAGSYKNPDHEWDRDTWFTVLDAVRKLGVTPKNLTVSQCEEIQKGLPTSMRVPVSSSFCDELEKVFGDYVDYKNKLNTGEASCEWLEGMVESKLITFRETICNDIDTKLNRITRYAMSEEQISCYLERHLAVDVISKLDSYFNNKLKENIDTVISDTINNAIDDKIAELMISLGTLRVMAETEEKKNNRTKSTKKVCTE